MDQLQEALPPGYELLSNSFEHSPCNPVQDLPNPTTVSFIPIQPEDKAAALVFAAKKVIREESISLQFQYQQHRKKLAEQIWATRKRMRRNAELRATEQAEARVMQRLLDVEVTYHEVVGLAAQECLETVRRICQLVLHRELQIDPMTLGRIIEGEVVKLQFSRLKGLKVHPDNKALAEPFGLLVTLDSSLESDQAVIVTAAGEVHISLKNDLERIVEELRAMLVQQHERASHVS